MSVGKYLIQHGLVVDLDEAMRQVMAGNVVGHGKKYSSVHEKVDPDDVLRLKKVSGPYVSRGGDKLASVLNKFNLKFRDKVGLDCGASTGGFTDVCLQQGAKAMITVDVGYGVLHDALRKDSRVLEFERMNIREVDGLIFREKVLHHPKNKNSGVVLPVDFIVADVSFISLTLVLPVLKELVRADGDVVLLCKPQFEAPRNDVPAGGVVTDPLIITQAIDKVKAVLPANEFILMGQASSLVKGPKGNQEIFLHCQRVAKPE